MLKLNASYSKKVPAEQEYSSKSYHASIECELPSGQTAAQLKQKIHDTFKLVEASVDAEIAEEKAHNNAAQPASQNTPRTRPHIHKPSPSNPPHSTSANNTATNSQIQYIVGLAEKAGQGLPELNTIAQNQFGAESIYQLNRKDASALLDQLKTAA